MTTKFPEHFGHPGCRSASSPDGCSEPVASPTAHLCRIHQDEWQTARRLRAKTRKLAAAAAAEVNPPRTPGVARRRAARAKAATK